MAITTVDHRLWFTLKEQAMAHDKQVPNDDDGTENDRGTGVGTDIGGGTAIGDPRDPPYQRSLERAVFDPGPSTDTDLEQWRKVAAFVLGDGAAIETVSNQPPQIILCALTPGTVVLRMKADLMAVMVRPGVAAAVRDLGGCAGWHWHGASFDERGRLRLSMTLRTTGAVPIEDAEPVIVAALESAHVVLVRDDR